MRHFVHAQKHVVCWCTGKYAIPTDPGAGTYTHTHTHTHTHAHIHAHTRTHTRLTILVSSSYYYSHLLGAGSFINSASSKRLANVVDSTVTLHFRTPDGVTRPLEVVVFDTAQELKAGEQVLWWYGFGKEIHGYDARTLLSDAQLNEFIPTFCTN